MPDSAPATNTTVDLSKVRPDINGGLIGQAIMQGLQQLSPIIQDNTITEEFTDGLSKVFNDTADISANQYAMQALVQELKADIMSSSEEAISDLAPAEAGLLSQYLSQPSNPAGILAASETAMGTKTAQEIVSGLGEGVGEGPTASTQENNRYTAKPTKTAVPDGGSMGGPAEGLPADDSPAQKVKRGQENLPMFDQSSKAKEEFAKRELSQQDTERETKTEEESGEELGPAEMLAAQRGLQQNQHQDQQQHGTSRTAQAQANAMADAAESTGIDDEETQGQIQGLRQAGGQGGGKANSRVGNLGEQLESRLAARISSDEFSGFEFALILALGKDFIDFLDPSGAVPMFINIFVSGALTTILLNQGGAMQARLQRNIGKLIMGVLIEFIPIFELIPAMTLMIIELKLASDIELRKRKKGHSDLVAITSSMKKGLPK